MSALKGILLLKSVPRAGAPPTAVADSFGPFTGGTTQFLNVLGNDLNVPATPDIQLLSQPAAGVAQVVSDLTSDAKIQVDLPSPASQTSYTFQYSLNDSAPVTVTVIVAGPASAPLARNDTYGPFSGGSTQLLDVLTNDVNLLASPIIAIQTQPSAGAASVQGNQIRFVCASPVAQTNYTFTYTVDGSNAATVTVTVLATTAPVAVADSYGPFAGGSVQSLNVLSNDQNVPTNPDIATGLTQPSAGSTTVTNNGTSSARIQFTCANPASQTSYTFQYKLSGSALVTVTVIVAAPVSTPIASSDSYGPFAGGSTQTLNVAANDANLTNGNIGGLTQPSAGSVSIILNPQPTPDQLSFVCASPTNQTDYTFQYTIDSSNTATITVTVAGTTTTGSVNLGQLTAFTPAQIQVTTLSGWPAGRKPSFMVTQGDQAYGYVRRSWKPNNNNGNWMDIVPGWQPTSAPDTMRVQLDDGSQLDLAFTVVSGMPAATKTLDASATPSGSTYNTWASAIAALVAGDVLVVRAKTGTRVINGRNIPYSTYPADVGGNGAVTSTVNNVTIYADPTDVAAGRRPRIHVNGTDLAGFYDDPNGMWVADTGNVWKSVRTTYPAPVESVNAHYVTSTGRRIALYDYYHPSQGSYLNQIRDTAYNKVDMYIGSRTQTYAGPGITWSGGQYYVRLERPAQSTVTKGAFSGDPWYWGDYIAPSLNPNTVPLIIQTCGHGGSGYSSCLKISGCSGWKIYNIDVVPGSRGIAMDNSSGCSLFGCRFLGVNHPEHIDTDNTNYMGCQLFAAGATNVIVDRCEFFGGQPPWHTWSEGKGWTGAWGPSVRNTAYWQGSGNILFRHCYFGNFFHLTWFNGGVNAHSFHHCLLENSGCTDGLFVTAVPSGVTEMIRSRLLTCSQAGWSGGGATQVCHWVNNFVSRYVPASAAHRALHTHTTSGGAPTSFECDYMPVSIDLPHAGVGSGGEMDWFYLQNSVLGSQRHWQTAYNLGAAASPSPNRPNQFIGIGNFWRAYNNLCAVYPSHNGYIWSTSYTQANPLDSFAANLIRAQSLVSYDYNHFYRSPSMPSTGKNGLAWVWNYPSGGNGTNCANIAAIKAQGIETNGSEGDPGWSVSFPQTTSDRLLHAVGNFIPTGTAASGGNTGLSGQGAHDYDVNAPITYTGRSWRGCFQPGVPAIEQDVGILGPSISTLP